LHKKLKNIITQIALILCFTLSVTYSQSKCSLTGEVKDKITQSLIPEVIVRIIGSELTAKTDTLGKFIINNVPAGTYEVQFTNVAYKILIKDNVVVSPGRMNMLTIEMQTISTEEVTVESPRFQKPTDISTSYKSLSFEELRRTPGGLEDIGRVIQNLPGAALTNDGRNDIAVRGGSPAENLFVVDGFEVNNINHFGSQGATGGPISIINLDFVSQVDFLTGGFSAKYGDRLSSVVDIKLRQGSSDKFYGKINLSGIGFGGNAEGPLPFDKQGSWLVSARRSYLDLIFNAAGFSFVPEYTDFEGKFHFNIGNKNFINFNSFGAIDKVRFNNNTEQNKQDNERILTNDQNSYASGLSWKSLLSSRSFLLVTLSRNFVNYTFSQRDSNFVSTFDNNSKEGDVQLKAEYFLKPSSTTYLSFGAGAKTIKLNYDINKAADTLDETDPITGNRIVIPPLLVSLNERTYKAFAYAEAVKTFFQRFKLTLGLRYDYFGYITDKNYLSPRTSLSITLNPKTSLNFAYGIFYQSPSYIWLAGAPDNRNLREIRADHYVAGVDYLLDEGTKLTVEFYYKKYKYYPVSTIRPYLILANNGGFETQNSFGLEPLVSQGTGVSRGAEIFLQKTLTKRLYGTIGLSYCDAKYKAYNGIERRSDFDNIYILNVGGGYKIGSTWEVSAKFRLAGGLPYTPINPADGTIDYTKYNSLSYPAYHRLDMRAEKRWDFRAWTLTTYIDIQNIYNQQNIYEYRWDKYKKEIVTDKNLGILPTVGINAEF
jgi:outer membrane receptor protein involved in Fe transport